MLPTSLHTDERGDFLAVTCRNGQFRIDVADATLLGSYRWFIFAQPKRHSCRYVVRSTDRGFVMLHREIMQAPKGMEVDHIDGDGTNDRRFNMRLATHAQNKGNSHYPKLARGGYRGVNPTESGRFSAVISLGGKLHYLGTFDDPIEAATAWDAAAVAYRGEFTQLNFPERS